MDLNVTRRDFIKYGVISGITIYTSPVFARILKNNNSSNSPMFSESLQKKWNENNIVKTRMDALAKVTGAKIYGRDLRSIDMPGWPKEQEYAYILRATHANKIFLNIDLSMLPAELKPKKIILNETIVKDGVELPPFYRGVSIFTPKNTQAEYLGQAVAMLIFSDFLYFYKAKQILQFNPNVIRYGKETDLLYKERDPYGAFRVIRVQGNESCTKEDVYSTLKNGMFFPVYKDHKPLWPKPNLKGNTGEEGMEYAEIISQSLTEDPNCLVMNRNYQTQIIDPMPLEPECFNGWFDETSQTLHAIITCQDPSMFFMKAPSMLNTGPLKGKIKNLVIHSAFVGGGFGCKDHSILPCYGLLATMYSDGPVRLPNDRFDQFQAGIKRHPFKIQNTLAVDKKTGKFKGIISKMELDGGGRANFSAAVAQVGSSGLQSIYYFPQNDIQAVAYPSENPDNASMRGFGTVQSMFSTEMMVNEAAALLNKDPIDLRLINAIKPGQFNTQGALPRSTERYQEILNLAKNHGMWVNKEKDRQAFELANPNKLYGVGFAMCTKDYGTGNEATATYIQLGPDGHLEMGVSSVEIGTGAQTSQAALIGEYFGRPADNIHLGLSDAWAPLQMFETDNEAQQSFTMTQSFQDKMQKNPRWTPAWGFSTSASSTAFFQSKSTRIAANIIFEHALWPAAKALWSKLYFNGDLAEYQFGAMSEAKWVDGKLTTQGMMPLDLPTLAEYAHNHGFVVSSMVHTFNRWAWGQAEFNIENEKQVLQADGVAIQYGKGANSSKKGVISSDGWHLLDRQNMQYPAVSLNNAMVVYYAPCATMVALSVDKGTGEVGILHAHSWLDAGKVLVKELVEGQIEGGLVMGLGQALYEELPSGPEGSGNGTWNLNRYQVPLASQVGVWNMTNTILPTMSGDDTCKGIAEVAMIPIIPAIAEALYQTTKHRFHSLPITAKDVREALL